MRGTVRVALYVAGALILGALGNAVYEYALKPLIPLAAGGLLNVVTFGVQSLKDQTYAEIARGNYERGSLVLLTAFNAFVLVSTSLLVFASILTLRYSERLKEFFKPPSESKLAKTRRILIACCIGGSLASGFIFLSGLRTVYIVRASNHLEQLQRIVAPYISPDARLSVASRVAQIQTEADYKKVVDQLTAIAIANHLNIPSFDLS